MKMPPLADKVSLVLMLIVGLASLVYGVIDRNPYFIALAAAFAVALIVGLINKKKLRRIGP